jgi:translation initiation factor 2B subunit (eIF-2B alpha/beta/delta family)
MNGEAWKGIHGAASDRLSGASDIVRRAAEALAALPSHDVEEAVFTLIRGQPSMAPLWRLGTEALGSRDHAEAARRFAIRVASESDRIATEAAALLPDLLVVHSFSSTVIAAVAGAGSEAICARSEPGGEGATTAKMLVELGVRARLVEDHAAFEAVGEAGAVVVGADAVGPAGVVNKVGTLRLAEASRRYSTPCFALAGESKLLAVDVPAPHPFERTPLDLFTSVVTEDGPLTPSRAARLAGQRTLHPLLAGLLEELT